MKLREDNDQDQMEENIQLKEKRGDNRKSLKPNIKVNASVFKMIYFYNIASWQLWYGNGERLCLQLIKKKNVVKVVSRGSNLPISRLLTAGQSQRRVWRGLSNYRLQNRN